MKKIMLIMGALLLAVMVVGCGKKAEPAPVACEVCQPYAAPVEDLGPVYGAEEPAPSAEYGRSITNVVTASSDQAPDDQDTNTVWLPIPTLEIVKTHTLEDNDGSKDLSKGDKIHYFYSVTNIGSANLTNVVVNDDMLGAVILSDAAGDGVGFMAAGANETGHMEYTVS